MKLPVNHRQLHNVNGQDHLNGVLNLNNRDICHPVFVTGDTDDKTLKVIFYGYIHGLKYNEVLHTYRFKE
jgi:hypothetical protein